MTAPSTAARARSWPAPRRIRASNTSAWGEWLLLQEVAAHCARNIHVFIGREVEFIEGINEQLQFRSEPTEPQVRWLRDLFMRKLKGKIM
jgi:hypothetical protein